jgi:hypothetical protein
MFVYCRYKYLFYFIYLTLNSLPKRSFKYLKCKQYTNLMLTQTETSYFFLSFIKQYRPKTSRIGKFVGSDDFLICKGKVYRLVERFKGGQINVVNDNHSEWPLTVI